MWQLILGGIGVVVLIWTFWQVVSLLVWRKQNVPIELQPYSPPAEGGCY
jgi:hypothetical protein